MAKKPKEMTPAEQAAYDAALLKKLENVSTNDQMDSSGFVCIGPAYEVLGDLSEHPEVYVWRSSNGTVVTMYDEGDNNCSFVKVIRMGKGKNRASHNVNVADLVLV